MTLGEAGIRNESLTTRLEKDWSFAPPVRLAARMCRLLAAQLDPGKLADVQICTRIGPHSGETGGSG